MKKIIIALLLCLSLCGCSNNKNNAIYDYKECESVQDINSELGVNLVTAAIAGKSDEKFGIISGSIGQYSFTANGEEWCLRASKNVDEDISGLYYDSITFTPDMTSVYYTDEVNLFRFFYDNAQYTISLDVKDKDISNRHFDDVCYEFKTNITGIKSGYETDIYVDGDDVVYVGTTYDESGSPVISKTVYSFVDDKMVSIKSDTIFESNDKLNEYLQILNEYGMSLDGYEIGDTTITLITTEGLDYYADYTKDSFYSERKAALE